MHLQSAKFNYFFKMKQL